MAGRVAFLRLGGWAELTGVTLLAWAGLLCIPLGLGAIGLSWDALNHHIYLGWVADQARFDRDYLAASYQAYQYPYLFWPAYKLVAAGASGSVAGAVLVSLHVFSIAALWVISRVCIPEGTWYAATMRAAAVLLGFLGQVVLSLMDTTANDVLAAAPFLWAVACAMLGAQAPTGEARISPHTWALLSGLCAGVSVAFKLSNGPLALVLPVLWLSCGRGLAGRSGALLWAGAGATAGFALAYGPWGWQLWQHFGNPIYPFNDGLFAPLRSWIGGSP